MGDPDPGWCSNCDAEGIKVRVILCEVGPCRGEETTVCDPCYLAGWQQPWFERERATENNKAIARLVNLFRYCGLLPKEAPE